MQESGVLLKARRTRYMDKKKNKRQKKEDAIYRSKVREEADKLRKKGTFDEEKFKDIKKRISSDLK